MRIDNYTLGHITVDGIPHDNDLMICGDKLYVNWWREDHRSLCLNDLEWILDQQPEKLIIGKGTMGRMDVPEEVLSTLKNHGITVETLPTDEAVRVFNEAAREKSQRVGAALRLSC